MSRKVERSQIDWRRNKVAEVDSQGHSQTEISKILQVSIGTVNRDLSVLRQQAKEKIRKYIDQRLPEEYEKCLVGVTAILKEAWTTSQQTEDRREKIQALLLAKDCYSMKLDMLTNATVVGDAIRLISSQQQQQQEKAKANSCVVVGKDNVSDDIQGTIQDDKQQQQQQHTSTTTNHTF